MITGQLPVRIKKAQVYQSTVNVRSEVHDTMPHQNLIIQWVVPALFAYLEFLIFHFGRCFSSVLIGGLVSTPPSIISQETKSDDEKISLSRLGPPSSSTVYVEA